MAAAAKYLTTLGAALRTDISLRSRFARALRGSRLGRFHLSGAGAERVRRWVSKHGLPARYARMLAEIGLGADARAQIRATLLAQPIGVLERPVFSQIAERHVIATLREAKRGMLAYAALINAHPLHWRSPSPADLELQFEVGLSPDPFPPASALGGPYCVSSA